MRSGDLLSNRYQLGEPLGQGGMGTVWLARDRERDDAEVAVKVVAHHHRADPEGRERFGHEVRATARVKSPYCAALLDADLTDEGPYLVMEYIAGRSLSRLIRPEVPMDVPRVVTLLRHIVQGVTDAHRVGILHRDISSDNVMVRPDGRAVICDFGIAKLFTDPSWTPLTQPGYAVGKAAYMAPERRSGSLSSSPVDTSASDLYSVGCVAYEMLTGAPPFGRGLPQQELLEAHSRRIPVPLRRHRPDVPQALARLVEALLAKSPADRPVSADFTGLVLDVPPLSANGSRRGEQLLADFNESSARTVDDADSLTQTWNYGEALPPYQRVAKQRTLVLGPTDERTLVARQRVADCLWRMGEREDSVALCQELVALLAETLGPDNNRTLAVVRGLAGRLAHLERHEEALPHLDHIADALARTSGPDTPVALEAAQEYAQCLLHCGHPKDATPRFRGIAERRAVLLGSSAPGVLYSRLLLGRSLVEAGEHEEGLAVLHALAEDCERLPPVARVPADVLSLWTERARAGITESATPGRAAGR